METENLMEMEMDMEMKWKKLVWVWSRTSGMTLNNEHARVPRCLYLPDRANLGGMHFDMQRTTKLSAHETIHLNGSKRMLKFNNGLDTVQ